MSDTIKIIPGEKQTEFVIATMTLEGVDYRIKIIQPTRRMIFTYYDEKNGYGYETDLLVEQGEPYLPGFHKLMKRQGWDYEQARYDGYIYNRLVVKEGEE